MISPHRAYLGAESGVYVAQYPHAVKIGQALHLRQRLRQHRTNGATRITTFLTEWHDRIEIEALFIARELGVQVGYGTSEYFAELTFEDAVRIIEAVLAHYGMDVSALAVEMDRLAAVPWPPLKARPGQLLTVGERT